MHLLQSGVPLEVIALWLGHEQVATTHSYLEADLTMKNQILSQLKPTPWLRAPKRSLSNIIAFLEAL
jgi:site-specific recombinase XerD